ncbi:sugar (pentulose or hexulose) kinase [Mucilaginibacter yixingensis]|uniref:Sugar (Pentulose or hexulose) kinase n=1 Tax=Mucilaginibacter yixingensis TaxID=1295612 RepID=A0A2T5JB49_9SPHI|nr:FGGY family carbohydrate kinase [Mucilaginibacter yixingensis]PTQ98098.1 sugar (pentulose or hexulose) kinase [Mucilaginibacter yixingensis]
MTTVPVIAIFDIGKTNKKFFLINEYYKIVLERTTSFEETVDDDGDPCEDVALLQRWVKEQLHEILSQKKFDIRAINFSTYGASFVHIDHDGKVTAPLCNYLKSFPEDLKQEFYAKHGGEEKIAAETASPVLGNLNSGMQLFRIKQRKPELFERIKYSLHLPQFLNYLVTGNFCSDITSIGCHTQLWNFNKQDYHQWVYEEGIDRILAPIFPSDKVTETEIDGHNYQVGTGLHDSSAALIPYLANFAEPFVLISTGTWCISLNPFNNNVLTPEELAKDCLCYMEYHGRPVKASRLFAGNEHEQQTRRMAEHFNKPNDYFKKVKYNPDFVAPAAPAVAVDENQLLKQSAFGSRDLSTFKTYEDAYHCLIADIMVQQKTSTQMAIQDTKVKRIFVDGGFSKNPVYMNLLAKAFPLFEVYAASVAQATAIGAALAIHKFWNNKALPADMIELKYYAVAQNIEI